MKPTALQLFATSWANSHLNLFENDYNKANAFVKNFTEGKEKLNNFIKTLGEEYQEVIDFVNEMNNIDVTYIEEIKEFSVDDKLVSMLSANMNSNCVKKINKPLNYDENIAVCEAVRKKEEKYLFLISNEFTLTGKILGKVRDNKIKIDLINHYSTKEDDFVLYFGKGSTRAKSNYNLSAEFYSYFFDADNKNYLLLSMEPIKGMRVTVSGMKVSVSDKMVVGESFQLPSNLTVIFAHHTEDERRSFDVSEIEAKIGKLSYDGLREMFFGKYHHPIWLEKMILCVLFSHAYEGYPAHLVILGPPKTGKTASIITPICTAIPDLKQNGQSTFRGLIPSFGGKGVAGFNEGALLRADRICYLDEFMTPITSGSNNYAELSNQFGKINSILEWNVGDISSGLGKSVSVMRPTMQVLACGNFQHGCEDMTQTALKINNAGMSRMIWYSQNQENIDFLNGKVAGIMKIPFNERLPPCDGKAIMLYDFFKQEGNTCDIDFDWVIKKHKEFDKYVSKELKDVYTRYDHHLTCMLDGISKLRWITGEKEDFRIVDEKDYQEAEEIFSIIISSWMTEEDDLVKKPKYARVKHLQTNEREVYEYINAYNGSNLDEIQKNFKFNIDTSMDLLKRWGLVYSFEDKYYCYWTNMVKERNLEVTCNGQNLVSQWNPTDL